MKLLKFSASWCPSCRQLGKVLEENPIEGLEVYEVDVEEDEDVAERYGIRNLPTCVLLSDNGDFIKKFFGFYQNIIPDIKKEIEAYVQKTH